ncbi:receptor activity-modifying protein 3-like isoform X1 [Acipenser oxyrinchus oxyrinchus]|uniref:Receptor activity-modifying protein 3 n=1 Tax=Acipenser oxyrinchus oxyrinchus TaxID=40147 RepID=A0AAD8GG40_ACIOX|nr:receptor activity-modifying protein 3-like isoform X1 [Acipenser oxyrinchus oxyrinchus]
MDTNAFFALKLFVLGICANILMTSGLSATEDKRQQNQKPNAIVCNETALMLDMLRCEDDFKRDMDLVDPKNWCNLTYYIKEYNTFSTCTEKNSERIGCFWPNPFVESFIISLHKHFFSNCTSDQVIWEDPPDNMLTILIVIPVLLTVVMIALVVWCSKRNDILV